MSTTHVLLQEVVHEFAILACPIADSAITMHTTICKVDGHLVCTQVALQDFSPILAERCALEIVEGGAGLREQLLQLSFKGI